MEIILLILAGAVVYYLYITLQEYLKNPITPLSKDSNITTTNKNEDYDLSLDPYVNADPLDKLKKTESGLMVAITNRFLFLSKGLDNLENNPTKKALLDGFIEGLSKQLTGTFEEPKKSLQEIFGATDTIEDLQSLCKMFLQSTYGEYKKSLKLIEFLFALAYSDRELDENEKENIIDIAAFLELNNEDFNQIYDDFAAQNDVVINMTHQEALSLLGIEEPFEKEALEEKFELLIKEKIQSVLDVKNINKSFAKNTFPKIQEIQSAYNFLQSKE